jgi:amphiphysin
LPPGVLYKVKASYKYQAEDVDELNFEVGELIDVVTYDDPDEQASGVSFTNIIFNQWSFL